MLTAWILYAYVYTVLIFDIARFASYMLVKYYCYSDPSFYLFFIFIYLFIFWGGDKKLPYDQTQEYLLWHRYCLLVRISLFKFESNVDQFNRAHFWHRD